MSTDLTRHQKERAAREEAEIREKRELLRRIEKLPQWAQDHIEKLELNRREAVEALNKYRDSRDKGNVMFTAHVSDGEQRGPRSLPICFDTHALEIMHAGVHVNIALLDDRIRVAYTAHRRFSLDPVYLKPTSFQAFELLKELKL